MTDIKNSMIDITPTPRVLKILGDIPFQPWQCIAELIDNSIDAFLADEKIASDEKRRMVTVTWTGDSVASHERSIEITDNARGMTLDQLQNAVRAGYSSNDAIENLGLFGVGFNIATARLGDLTTILSTRGGDKEWVGLEIDFSKMLSSKRFDAPIIRKAKEDFFISGTIVKISRLKQGIIAELPNKEREIRQRLGTIYSPLLASKEINITVKGKPLKPRTHCAWSGSRYVLYNNQTVPARIEIDRVLSVDLFDMDKNCYLSADEAEPLYAAQQIGRLFPDHIVERSKRLTGWLGIQRYADPNDFGIDFIRNGRKILVSDKSFFQYENQFTGQKELQYPLELGSTVGGRIVGELHVDYLLPTYQKNDFDRSDNSWIQTVEAICGTGPFLRKSRKALGFIEQNTSPLATLVNAYRRVDAGTKCLSARNDVARLYAVHFRKGVRDYIDDDLWWKAAQEEDQKRNTGGERATPVNKGEIPSDDISSYFGDSIGNDSESVKPIASTLVNKPQSELSPMPVLPETSTLDELIQRSNLVTHLGGKNYKIGNTSPLKVRAYELEKGSILVRGEQKACFFSSDGIECDFVYNPMHPLLAQYPITPKMLLLQYLSEKLKARDNLSDIVLVYSTLVENTMQEAKIDKQSLHDRASDAFELLREKLSTVLKIKAKEVVECIHESSGDVEETITNLIQSNPLLIDAFQSRIADGYDAIDFVPPKTLYRLVEKFSEDVFDGKVLSALYLGINLPDENATRRARDESRERSLSFIKDALRVISGYSQRAQKNELTRAALSVDFLLRELGS